MVYFLYVLIYYAPIDGVMRDPPATLRLLTDTILDNFRVIYQIFRQNVRIFRHV